MSLEQWENVTIFYSSNSKSGKDEVAIILLIIHYTTSSLILADTAFDFICIKIIQLENEWLRMNNSTTRLKTLVQM